MPRLSDIERAAIFGPDGAVAGEVERVLFHPSEPRVVGFQIRPNPFYYVVKRKAVFVPLGNVDFAEGGRPQFATKKLPTGKGEGFDWAVTVVWRGMPVATPEGDVVGVVHDAGFTKKSGRLTWLEVSAGAVSDTAVGRNRYPGEAAVGFDGEAVVLDPSRAEAETSGGLAKAAGAGAAAVTVHGERLAKAAGDATVAGAIAVGKSFKSGTARKAIDHVKRATGRWMADDDEDE